MTNEKLYIASVHFVHIMSSRECVPKTNVIAASKIHVRNQIYTRSRITQLSPHQSGE